MRKIGIITITGLGNYGNRLQNFALQQTIENLPDCRCETFKNNSCSLKGYVKRAITPRHVLSPRELIFQSFNDEYVHFSDISINNIFINSKLRDYDCLVCGSDQIWNSDYRENGRANFGYFFPNMKVISYAASFGTNDIADYKKRQYAKYLNALTAISVREEKGRELAIQLTGRNDVYVHSDPTLLLSSEEWMSVEKAPKIYKGEKYILKYFLGKENDSLSRHIEQYATEHGLTVIDAISHDSPYHHIGPSEFLFLERNAELIITDSFHACVFAIINQRPFIVAERNHGGLQSMGSRIDTLLAKFNLEGRKYVEDSFDQAALPPDYSMANQIINSEKQAAFDYLRKYLVM